MKRVPMAEEILSPWNDPSAYEVGPACPPLEQLSLAISGGLTKEQIARFIRHSTECARCNALLKQIADEPIDESIDADAEAPDPVWIRPLAERMAKEARGAPAHVPVQSNWGRWATAAAVMLAIGGGLLWTWFQGDSPEQLLATAYSESRPFDYRMVDDGYGPVRQQRSAGGSVLDRPRALMDVQPLIRTEVERSPDAARTLWLRGDLELLDGQYDVAIESLTRAMEADPNDAQVLVDLAIAYALRGDFEQRALDLGRAADLLLAAERLDPEISRAAFNLALTYERMSMPEEARDAWMRFLALEPDGGWADEARQHVQRLGELIDNRDAIRARIVPDPAAFLAWAETDRDGVNAEWFQDIAWKDWLPAVATEPAAADALQLLGDLFVERHGDTSIRDALNAALIDPVGTKELAEAANLVLSGSYDEAYVVAVDAEQLLRRNPAARVRAGLEKSYGMQRRSFRECMDAAQTLSANLAGTSYVWLRGQAALQEAICDGRDGNYAGAQERFVWASQWFRRAGFDIQALRADGASTTLNWRHGDAVAVWKVGLEGLRQAWALHAPPTRTQQFASDLAQSADALGLKQLTVVFQASMVRDIVAIGNPLVEAVDRVYLAAAQLAADDKNADVELEHAEKIFASLSPSPTVNNFRIYAQQLRLETNPDMEERVSGLMRLEDAWPDAGWNERFGIRRALGTALHEQGRNAEARTAFQAALDLYTQQLNNITDPVDRLAAVDLATASVQAMIELEFELGSDPANTLAIWDRYGPSSSNRAEAGARMGPDMAALIYVPLETSVAAWLVRADDTRGVQVHGMRVELPLEEVQRVARRLQRLSSQPNAPLEAIRQDARQLHQWLVAPFQSDLDHTKLLMVDAADWLAGIPFPALLDESGSYLIEKYAIAFGSRLNLAADPLPTLDRGLILSVPSPGGSTAQRFPALVAAQRETENAANHFRQPLVLTNSDLSLAALETAAPSAQFLHFAGHGWSNGGDGGLVLPAPGIQAEPVFLTSASLNRHDWRRLELAVLSACMSGTGERWGPANPHSLVRAFLSGGAKRVIAAQWNADSGVAATLMDHFYERLEDGRQPAFALADAKRALLAQPQWSHPYYWAPFTLYGTP